MSDSYTEKQLTERIKQVVANPRVAAEVVDHAVRNRPVGWGKRSNSPYYKERYAMEMKAIADEMLQDKEDRYFSYEDYKQKYGIGKDTLYLRINQAFRYLVERMDTTDHLYARFLETVEITRERGKGIMVRFIPQFREGGIEAFKPRKVIPKEEIPKWKIKIDEFLENGDVGGVLFIDKLALSPEEIADLKISMAGVKNVMCNITSYSIKMVKINSI